MIAKAQWDKFRPKENPFLDFNFLDSLTKSGSASPETGWQTQLFEHEGSALLTFIKSHSYGEYIFDWGWAEAYERHGIPYYPKMTSMIPFTPVTTKHFLMPEFNQTKADQLVKKHDEFYNQHALSSAHFLFLEKEEIDVFASNDYLIRESMQYHFFNENYADFEDFLNKLKTKKAKNLRNERRFENLQINQYTGDNLTSDHAQRMYQFYISTILNKNSFDYLNENFFKMIFETMKENLLYVEATRDDLPVAGSLFLFDSEKIYGRYWGSNQFIENLHFELCYYQGIDFCIKNKLKVFEAGAQGEHKIARGFRPVRNYSAHKLKHQAFQSAIADFIKREKIQIETSIEKLSQYLPFR